MKLEEIVGQEAIQKKLLYLIEKKNLSHAYLFLGPKGSLKKTLAMTFAATILSSPQLNPNRPLDFEAHSLNLFKNESHPDFHLIQPEVSQIKIKQIRALKEKLSQYEKLANHTVVIIEDSDLMGHEASNAFLKTLEEPLGETIFILLASSQEKLLETILSRVQVFYFPPLKEATLEYYASRFPQFETKSPLEKKLLLKLSFGSLADLRALLENETSLLKGRDRLFDLLLALKNKSEASLALFTEALSKEVKASYKMAKEANETLTERQYQKNELKKAIFFIESFYQDLFYFHHVDKASCYHSDKLALYEKTRPDLPYDRLSEMIYQAYENLEHNTDYFLVFFVLLSKLKNIIN